MRTCTKTWAWRFIQGTIFDFVFIKLPKKRSQIPSNYYRKSPRLTVLMVLNHVYFFCWKENAKYSLLQNLFTLFFHYRLQVRRPPRTACKMLSIVLEFISARGISRFLDISISRTPQHRRRSLRRDKELVLSTWDRLMNSIR